MWGVTPPNASLPRPSGPSSATPSPQEAQQRQQEQTAISNCIAELANADKPLAQREAQANQLMEYARHPRKAQMMAKQAVKVVLGFLHPNNPLARKGAGLVANMSFNQWMTRPGKEFQTLLASYTVGPITQLLAQGTDADTESELLRALWTLSWRNSSAVNSVHACPDAISAIVKRLGHANVSVVIQAGGVLWSLGRSHACATSIFEAGGVAMLMGNLAHANVEVQYTSLCALGILVHESELCQTEALSLGCVDKFMGFLESSSGLELTDKQRADLASKAAEALTLLCFDKPDGQARFFAGGHMGKVVSWLKPGKCLKGLDTRKLIMIILSVCFNNVQEQIKFASQGGLQQLMELFQHPSLKYLSGLSLSTLCHLSLPSTSSPSEAQQRFEQIAEMRKYVYQCFDAEAPMLELIKLLELPPPATRTPALSQDYTLKMNVGLLILSQLCCPSYPNLQRRFAQLGGVHHLVAFLHKNETLQMGALALSSLVQGPLVGPPDLGFLSTEDISDPHRDIRDSVATESNIAVLSTLCKAVKNVRSADGRPDDTSAAAGAALASLALGSRDLLRVLVSNPDLDPVSALRILANKKSEPDAQAPMQDLSEAGIKRKLEVLPHVPCTSDR